MIRSQYHYALMLYRRSGEALGRAGLGEIDWEPAKECVRFQAIREGRLAADAGEMDAAVEPVWDERLGRPFMSAVRVNMTGRAGEPGGTIAGEVTTAYFNALARLASAELVERGELKEGELFQYRMAAYPLPTDGPVDAPAGTQAPKPRFTVEAVCPPLALVPASRDDLQAAAGQTHGKQSAQDPLAFLPRGVLEEATAGARQAGSLETGGVLIGHLHRDVGGNAGGGDIFIEVTAQIPARGGRSELTKFTFTPETWTAVDAAVALRRRDEIQLGWWHSHSYQKELCKDCQKAEDGSCKVTSAFLSPEDLALHRNCFPRAYSLALVVAESPCSGLALELFGWRGGRIVSRGYHILPGRGARPGKTEPLAAKGTRDDRG